MDDQLQFTIPGAKEIDAEAAQKRAEIERQTAESQPVTKPQSAFSIPDGPLFNLFAFDGIPLGRGKVDYGPDGKTLVFIPDGQPDPNS